MVDLFANGPALLQTRGAVHLHGEVEDGGGEGEAAELGDISFSFGGERENKDDIQSQRKSPFLAESREKSRGRCVVAKKSS